MRSYPASGTLLGGGAALSVITEFLHPHRELPNAHEVVFAEYAGSNDWVWVHDLQFLAAGLVVAGFVVLYHALAQGGWLPSTARIGLACANATLSMIAVNMAVDGVALKQAVNAWAVAPPQDRSVKFAAAETVRWVEWGANSFFVLLLGLTVLAFATAIVQRAAGTLRWIAVPGLASGAVLVVNGLRVGDQGFEPSPLPLVAMALFLVMICGIPALGRRPGRALQLSTT